MKNTGSLLQSKRESLGLTLSEVALSTKINPKVLAAIENGDEKALPAKTITKGFIRSYAQFLKMDVDSVMRTLQDEMGGAPSESVDLNRANAASSSAPPAATPTSRRRVDEESSSSGLRTAAVVVIVVLIGMIIGVRELIEKYQAERVVEPVPAVVADTPVVADDVKVSVEKPPTEKEPAEPAAEKPEPETAKVAEPEKPAEPVKPVAVAPTPTPPPTPPPAAAPAPPPAPTTPLVEMKPPQAQAPAAAGNPALKAVKNEIILEALDKVEVKFQVKGETKRVSLGPQEVHTIRIDQPITLDLSDGGAVNVILNGKERGVPGDLGKPKTIKIP